MQISLEKFPSSNIWIAEKSPVPIMENEKVTFIIDANKSQYLANEATVEIFKPIGPMAYYGLLGGYFTPNELSKKLIIEVFFEPDLKNTYLNSLAKTSDQVYVGLDKQYVDTILKFLTEKVNVLGSGNLVINKACCGNIGSSISFFKTIASFLIQCLTSSNLSNNQSLQDHLNLALTK